MAERDEKVAETLGLDRAARRHFNWVAYALLLAVVVAGGWYWLTRADAERGVEYVTAEATVGGFVVTVDATGTVEPTNLVEISSELSGTLDAVNVDFNDTVEVGTVLATLDTTQLEAQLAVSKAQLDAAEARIAMVQAGLDDAKQKFEAARDLEARGITPRQMFFTQEAAYIRARAEMESALADKALSEANRDLQQAILDKACICSPIRGIVLDRAADPGQIVASSLSAPILFTVAEDLSQMELQVDIDEADIGRIAVGNTATFTVDAYDDRRFPATVTEVRFAPQTVEGVVTYKAILTVDNSALLLRPGMTATAEISVAEIEDALVVPNAALRYAPPREPGDTQTDDDRSGLLGMLMPERPQEDVEGDIRTVWVMRDGEPEEIPVVTGDSDGSVTEVVGGTLRSGDLVITDRVDG